MNKFKIGDKYHPIGFCLCEVDNIECDFSELIGTTFKTTYYTKYVDWHGYDKKPSTKKVCYPKYEITRYDNPRNDILGSHDWKQIDLDYLKRCKYYNEYHYNGVIVYVGLNYISEDELKEMSNKKEYTIETIGDSCATHGTCHAKFDTSDLDMSTNLSSYSDEDLINELKHRQRINN